MNGPERDQDKIMQIAESVAEYNCLASDSRKESEQEEAAKALEYYSNLAERRARDLEAAHRGIRRINRENTALQSELERAKRSRDDARRERQELRCENEELHEQNEKLRQQIAEITEKTQRQRLAPEDMREIRKIVYEKTKAAAEREKEAGIEIILYADKPETSEFAEAVKKNRAAAGEQKKYKSLFMRLGKAAREIRETEAEERREPGQDGKAEAPALVTQ